MPKFISDNKKSFAKMSVQELVEWAEDNVDYMPEEISLENINGERLPTIEQSIMFAKDNFYTFEDHGISFAFCQSCNSLAVSILILDCILKSFLFHSIKNLIDGSPIGFWYNFLEGMGTDITDPFCPPFYIWIAQLFYENNLLLTNIYDNGFDSNNDTPVFIFKNYLDLIKNGVPEEVKDDINRRLLGLLIAEKNGMAFEQFEADGVISETNGKGRITDYKNGFIYFQFENNDIESTIKIHIESKELEKFNFNSEYQKESFVDTVKYLRIIEKQIDYDLAGKAKEYSGKYMREDGHSSISGIIVVN